MTESENIAVAKLRAAFRDVGLPSHRENEGLGHDDLVACRAELCSISDEDLLWGLPRVLIDLLESHELTPPDLQDLEFVIYCLNASKDFSPSHYDEIAKHFGEAAAENVRNVDRLQKEHGTSRFARLFSSEMACAILAWLRVVELWHDSRDYREDLNVAIEYWREFAKGDVKWSGNYFWKRTRGQDWILDSDCENERWPPQNLPHRYPLLVAIDYNKASWHSSSLRWSFSRSWRGISLYCMSRRG